MNEVKKCSLSGIAFSLDTEAYNELQNYLKALKESYKSSADGAEIVADIEARIAELILSTQESSRVVELPLVKNIIAQLGTPEDIKGDEEELVKEPLEGVEICGLMGMASFTEDQQMIRSEFTRLSDTFKYIKEKYGSSFPEFKELSMGMSNDYPIAIECGSTLVRIGTRIFGSRY